MPTSHRTIEPISITDPDDPRLDDVRNLNSSDSRPDSRDGKGLVIAEGNLVVPRLFASPYPVRTVVGFEGKVAEFLDATASDPVTQHQWCRDNPPRVYQVTRDVLKQVVGFDMHRGLVAAADRIAERTVEGVLDGLPELDDSQPDIIAVLEGVGDHENLGALFRNAAGLGVRAVLFGAATADPLYRRSVRVSMGHVLRIPHAKFPGTTTTWQRDLAWLQDRGYSVIAMTPNTETTLQEAISQAGRKVAIMVGAEGPGLTEHAMRAADSRAKIPMSEGTDSLNVATSAAIGFYAAQ